MFSNKTERLESQAAIWEKKKTTHYLSGIFLPTHHAPSPDTKQHVHKESNNKFERGCALIMMVDLQMTVYGKNVKKK